MDSGKECRKKFRKRREEQAFRGRRGGTRVPRKGKKRGTGKKEARQKDLRKADFSKMHDLIPQANRGTSVCVSPGFYSCNSLILGPWLVGINEVGLEDDVIALDFHNVQANSSLGTVEEAEHLKGSLVVQRTTRSRVDVGEHQVDVCLGEAVQREAIWNDVADIVVVALDMRLLAGLHRITVEYLQPGVTLSVKLEQPVLLKFCAAVSQEDREQFGG